MTANGRHARFYIAGDRGDPERFWMPVTYHRQIRGYTRQLNISQKLLRQMLRDPGKSLPSEREPGQISP
jgi:hypothetical protein